MSQQTSKVATFLFWLVAASLVLTLALFKAIPKRAEAASNECFARMQTLGSLVKVFAGKHQGRRPHSIEDFRELVPNMTPEAWTCPSNTDANYQFTPVRSDGSDVLIKCTVHGHFVTARGNAVKSRDAPAEQSVQPEPRAARFLKSSLVGRGPVNRGVRRQQATPRARIYDHFSHRD